MQGIFGNISVDKTKRGQNFSNTFKIYEFLSDMTELIMEKSHVSALNVVKYVKST